MMKAPTQRSRRLAWRLAGWGLVAGLLLIPAVAMLITDEVVWTTGDFFLAALLLIGGGLLIELIVWKMPGRPVRLALCLAVLAAVGVVWAEGAVGLFR
ncbi:hypothetical protein [Brevundimonas variabilis]|uniref:Peptidoglycan/LPS O-acetylase OafA/YrhL n=1 Tax=Brevundimonas variabilis TaxID=74312 RepID=A0A7W9CFN7_9CAUL|nr:hypothetical protein [Brevundimonas variabilis]MBB5744681.1 peptidoglycan/LPS O-acetylase OafA/YrhL [Brevundimonas variabilis]